MQQREMIIEIKATNNEQLLDQLIKKYRPLAGHVVSKYMGNFDRLEREDLVIECLLMIEKCVHTYNLDGVASFNTFVYIAMRNKIFNLKRAYNAKKRDAGKFFYFESVVTNTNLSYHDIICDEATQEYEYISKEREIEIYNFLSNVLKPLECDLYFAYINGKKVSALSVEFDLPKEKVRNKITYIKRKLRQNEENYKKTMI